MIAFCGLWYFSLPQELFNDPYSFIIEDREGSLLGARISSDEQWRFPIIQKVPQRFKECIITYEDKRFDGHIGIDFLAIARAVWQNIRAGEIVSVAVPLQLNLYDFPERKTQKMVRENY